MAYTSDRYSFPRPKKRSEQTDLLKDAEDTFYGGGHSQPTPTPTPTPQTTVLAMNNNPTGVLSSRNGASRVRNPEPNEGILPTTTGSQYVGGGGRQLGPQYNERGNVNPLPRGAVGIQGSQQDAFNTSLNGSQPQSSQIPTPGRPMSHTELATDIAKRNLTAAGSQLGTPQTPRSSYGGPATYSLTPEGNIDTNVPGGSVQDALTRMSQGETFSQNAASRVQPAESIPTPVNEPQIQQPQTNSVTPNELTNAGIRPGRYADAASPIVRSGTGYSFISSSGGKVDIAVDPKTDRRQGYGSAYGY